MTSLPNDMGPEKLKVKGSAPHLIRLFALFVALVLLFFWLCLFDQLEINCEAGSISGRKGNGSGSSTGGPRRPKGDKGGNAAGEGDKESLI